MAELNGGLSLTHLHHDFYKTFEEAFCRGVKETSTINLHCFLHLLESRRRTGPLWATSTEPFEAVYGILMRCFQKGTDNAPKQILQNFYLKDR